MSVSPGEQVFRAAGLSRRRFAEWTGAAMRGGRLESARIETVIGWLPRLAEHGIELHLELRAGPDGVAVVRVTQ